MSIPPPGQLVDVVGHRLHLRQLLRLGGVPPPYVLVGHSGATGLARLVVSVVSRGGLRREDEGILAPIWKLPPEARAPLGHMWTQPKFFEALGSQIATICESAAEVVRATPDGPGDVPLTVISSAHAHEPRLHAESTLARRSRRGRHVLAPDSGHWVPLDAPGVVADAIIGMVSEIRRAAGTD